MLCYQLYYFLLDMDSTKLNDEFIDDLIGKRPKKNKPALDSLLDDSLTDVTTQYVRPT